VRGAPSTGVAMTERRIGDDSFVVSGRAAGGDGFFAPGEPAGLVGLRDAAEAPVPPDFARRAALDRAAAELPPGPRR